MESVLKDHSLKEEILFVDIHADATSEKVCLGHFLDGRVSVVAGTHTHIQTADERILSRGTAYITDVGMTGAYDSSLGMDKEAAISRFTSVLGEKWYPHWENGRSTELLLKLMTKISHFHAPYFSGLSGRNLNGTVCFGFVNHRMISGIDLVFS